MDRNARSVLHQRRSRIGRRARATQAVEFFNMLTSAELLQTSEALLPEHRERAVSANGHAVHVHAPGAGERWLVPEGGQRLGSAARGRWAGAVQRSYRRVLPGTPAPAAGDGQHAHASNRPPSEPAGSCAVALARSRGQAGGRHRTVDARYPAEPSHVSPTEHAGTRGRLSPCATGRGDLPGHRSGAGCGDRATQRQR